jgi:hypothetical protein
MKKNIMLKGLNNILFLGVVLFIAIFTSCKDNEVAPPVITEIRNYAAAPNDTLVTSINPGQWIVIHGSNLKGVVNVSVNGSPINIKPGLFSDNTAVVQIPNAVPFNNIAPADLNTIKYATTEGVTIFNFDVMPPAATITGNSLLAKNQVGDSIFIYGTNLYLIESLTIAGVNITPLKTVSDGSSIGFVFPVIDAPQPWESVIVSKTGTYPFNISVEPEIFSVSNANPSKGDSIRVYGKNLNGISSITFGGATITDYREDIDGFYVEFKAPDMDYWSYASGPVTIVSTYGTATTPYKVNTQNGVTEGLLGNMEWGDYFSWAWWGDVSLTVNNNGGWIKTTTDFDGTMGVNNSMFLSFDVGVLDPSASKYCPLGNNTNQWLPVANLSEPVENWGLQFEMSVARPWNGGTLYIRTAFAEDNYVARFEPWKVSAVKTVDIETDGWQTVTIPLTTFKAKDAAGILGNGESLTSLANLLGASGNTGYNFTLKNFSDAPTKTGFYAAIDNIRVVRIK